MINLISSGNMTSHVAEGKYGQMSQHTLDVLRTLDIHIMRHSYLQQSQIPNIDQILLQAKSKLKK